MNDWRRERARGNARKREYAHVMEGLRLKAREALAVQLEISNKEQANWGHYYHCRHDGNALIFDWQLPKEHRCPGCGTLWTGEPFDSAWTGLAHSRLGRLSKQLAIRQSLEPDEHAWSYLRSTFLDYARYYAGFEVHGDIPYNGPGKLFAQTLDESHWIMDMALAYQWAGDQFPAEERERIVQGLFRPCARFLIDYKEKQIHNHAVLITSAISILGYILQDADIQRAGLHGEYGLYDQIARGVLPDGFWYEGAFSYHYYALEPIIQYALAVEGSEWDIRLLPAVNDKLKRMFDFPLCCLLPGGMFPSLNDAGKAAGIKSYIHYYEFAGEWYGDETYYDLLGEVYSEGAIRDSVYALICGRRLVNAEGARRRVIGPLSSSWHSSEGSGLTKLVNSRGHHVTVKHSPFGGEHDHMDRLGISCGFGSRPIIHDPGTVAYAVPAHYDWFKHTYSHNTVCLNGSDQPPADCRTIASGEEPWGQWVASSVAWTDGSYRMKDRIILPEEMCPWDEAAYDGSSVTRILALTEHLLLDLIKVGAKEGTEVDVLYHVSGEAVFAENWEKTDDRLSRLNQQLFKDKRKWQPKEQGCVGWSVGELHVDQLFRSSAPCSLYSARTPDNPPDRERHSLIQRFRVGTAGELWVINVFAFEAAAGWSLSVFEAGGHSYEVTVGKGASESRFSIRCQGDQAEVQYEDRNAP